jgi:hypothetical protein
MKKIDIDLLDRYTGKFKGREVPNLKEAFEFSPFCEMMNDVDVWLRTAACDETHSFDSGKSMGQLIRFADELKVLITAIQIMRERTDSTRIDTSEDSLPKVPKVDPAYILTYDQLENPMMCVEKFFRLFSIHKARAILWRWLLVIVMYKGNYPKPMYSGSIMNFYECLLCVVEVSYALLKRSDDETQEKMT